MTIANKINDLAAESLMPPLSTRRDLAVTIGQQLANEKPGTRRMELLNRLFARLSPADKLRCQSEIAQCKAAKRGLLLAVTAGDLGWSY